jgi:hypothetical protein
VLVTFFGFHPVVPSVFDGVSVLDCGTSSTLHGMKWSLFLKSYLMSAYEAVSRDALQISIEDPYIRMEFPANESGRSFNSI